MITDLPPALIFMAGALLLPFLPVTGRAVLFPVFPLAALAIVALAPDGVRYSTILFGHELILFQMNSMARLFGLVFAVIGAAGGLYALTMRDTAQRVAASLYMAGAFGVTFAGDLLTLLVFWELMALASTYLIWARRSQEADAAGWRYLMFHLFGGSLLLGGIVWQLASGDGLDIHAYGQNSGPGTWLILAGVCVNAAVPPLHAWLADAYPKATVSGAVFLSAFTTKSAVYVLARMFPGWEILVYAGLIMICLGSVYALLCNDIREILAYSTISQVGYMVAAVGIGSELALNGAAAHAFSHILYKALLFMAAGAILESTGRTHLTELGGLGRSLPLIGVLYLIGAAAISGLPFLNGSMSKPLIVVAADQQHRVGMEIVLIIGAVATVVHTGLRLPWYLFLGKLRSPPLRPVPISMHAAMIFLAALCLGFGLFPSALYQLLPTPVDVRPYTWVHLGKAWLIIAVGAACFWALRRVLAPRNVSWPDVDWFYRRSAGWARRWFVEGVADIFDWCQKTTDRIVQNLARAATHASWLRPKLGSAAYDPNGARKPVGVGVALTLLVLVGIALWSYFWR